MISSATTGPPTFAASAYCVQYISIACEAAIGHTCYYDPRQIPRRGNRGNYENRNFGRFVGVRRGYEREAWA